MRFQRLAFVTAIYFTPHSWISPRVSAGNGLFTLIGFMGMYTVLAILFLWLVYREIEHGPEEA